jgi:FkbM family methyltransferase
MDLSEFSVAPEKRNLMDIARIAKIVVNDFYGLSRVGGLRMAIRWLLSIHKTSARCFRERSLLPADLSLGEGPFRVCFNGKKAILQGPSAISGIREIWVRNVYLGERYLQIDEDSMVLDLGANIGIFTILALAHGAGVRVVAVEPGRVLNQVFLKNLEINGWQERVTLLSSFIGGRTEMQMHMSQSPQYQQANWVAQEDLIDLCRLEKIDFLKCDIEGSEFALFTQASPLLRIARQLAIELHDSGGDRIQFLNMLAKGGWEIVYLKQGVGGCIALAKKL